MIRAQVRYADRPSWLGDTVAELGGSPLDFADPTHVNVRNMRRLLAYVVDHSDGALR